MPIELNSVVNKWFQEKQVDTNGDGKVSREELASFTNKVAQKPINEQTWDEALAGKMIHSADNNGGQSFFDIISKFDSKDGLSPKDLEALAGKDGNAKEISGKDFNFVM